MIDSQLIYHNQSIICIIRNSYSVDRLLAALSNAERYADDLAGIKAEHRKREFLAIRVALKEVLGGEEKEIEYALDGKPMLTDGSFHISFSHCQNAVAVMIHPSMAVGIDIEIPSPKLERIHTRFLSERELAAYRQDASHDYLRVAWSVKEALYKIIGDTAYNFAEQLEIAPFRPAKSGWLMATHIETNKTYRVNYLLTDEYTLAFCIDGEA